MAKAILVMDMPYDCTMCKFWNVDDDECYATGSEELSLRDREEPKPDWCPLRELPQKKEEFELRECKGSVEGTWKVPLPENKGWNACLREILGEKHADRTN